MLEDEEVLHSSDQQITYQSSISGRREGSLQGRYTRNSKPPCFFEMLQQGIHREKRMMDGEENV